MARQRFIWPSLWSDPVLGRMPADEMLLYIGCFSLADDEGRILADPAFLRAHVFPYRDDLTADRVKSMRDSVGKASTSFHIYVVDGIDYICFTNWGEFQKPKYPKASLLPGPELAGRKSKSRHGEIVTAGGRSWVRRGYVKKHVRDAVYQRDGNACVECKSASNLQIDHVVPVSRGGSNEPDNLRTLCRSCNSRKGNRETIPQNRETIPETGATGRDGLGWVGLDRDGPCGEPPTLAEAADGKATVFNFGKEVREYLERLEKGAA